MSGVRQTESGNVLTEDGVAQTEVVTEAIIDSWEDGDFAEWSDVFAGWTTQTSFATHGTIGARYDADSNNAITRSTAEDGILPEQGHIQKWDWQTDVGTSGATGPIDYRIQFADDGTDWYEVHHDVGNGNFEVWLRGSTNSRFIFDNPSYAANTHYQTEVIWDDGTLGGSAGDFTVTITNVDTDTVLVTGSGNNNAHTGPGDVVISVTTGQAIVFDFDYWRITNP